MTEPSENCPYALLRSSFVWLHTISDLRGGSNVGDPLSGIIDLFCDLHASGYSEDYDFNSYVRAGTHRRVHPLLRQVVTILHEYGRYQAAIERRGRSLADFLDRLHALGYSVEGEAGFDDLASSIRPRRPNWADNSTAGNISNSWLTAGTSVAAINWIASSVTFTRGTDGGTGGGG